MAFSLFQILKGLKITQENTLTPTNVVINPGGTANTTTTIQASQTTDKTLTLPDATDTLVGKATTDTLTNKSIDAATNTVSNLADANIKTGANIDAAKVGTGVVSTTEFNYLDGVTSAIQTQLDAKQATGNYITALTGDVVATGPGSAAATIQPGVVTDSKLSTGINANKIGAGAVDNTEFSYLDGVTSAIQTQIDSKAPISTTVTLTGTQTLTNKTLTEPIINDIVLTQIATPANPAANSNKVYTKSDNKLYVLNSDGTETVVGSGGTGVNFIVGGDAEGLNPFLVTKNTAAASRPDSGFVTSGTTITTSITSTTPLNGTKSFLITKPASNAQGNQASIPFSVPLEYRAKAITITLPYIVNTGTYVAGDRTTDSDTIIYIYDVTNSTFIEPSNIKFLSNSSSIASSVQATFQTSATGASYKFLVHVATTSAVAWELKCDDIVVGPQNYQYGTPVTDWQSYTPTGSWNTGVTYTGKYRRDGDSMQVIALVTGTGSPNAAALSVNIPSGYSIDSAKMLSTNSDQSPLGFGQLLDNGVASYPITSISYASSTSVNPLVAGAAGTYANQVTISNSVPFAFGSTDTVAINFSVPILGWSSSVQTSDQTDTRVVAFKAYRSANQAIVTGSILTKSTFDTVVFDTHGSFNSSTNTYVIPVPGYYNITSTDSWGNGAGLAVGYVASNVGINGSPSVNAQNRMTTSASLDGGSQVSETVLLKAGDTVAIYNDQNTGATRTISSGVTSGTFKVERISGPSAIAASESVNASYTNTAGSTIGTGLTTIPFATKYYDSHNAFVTDTYTIPISGKYRISAVLFTAGVSLLITQGFVTTAIQAGSASITKYLGQADGVGANNAYATSGSATFNCIAGDTIKIQAQSSVATTLNTGTGLNHFEIERVGN